MATPRSATGDWHGPGAPARRTERPWHALLWALVCPARRHRTGVTVTGVFLIGLALGIGTAAYNTASNILFLTLSLLLACLLLSGLLSWFNFRAVRWRLLPPAAWRAGHETFVTVELDNGKGWLPTYGLWLDFALQPRLPAAAAEGAETALSVRAALAAHERHVLRGRAYLRTRLEPGGHAALDWVVRPAQRGEHTVELAAVGSFFPFGFLRKSLHAGVRQVVRVWPAQVDYQWRGAAGAAGGASGRPTARAGAGEDLLALRSYAQGDSHRLIHWKASARLGRLMVRQFAAESLDGFVLRIDADAARWTRSEQFERMCSFAGTLAEDLFAAGRLRAVAVCGGRWRETRRLRDVEDFLDELAVMQPTTGSAPSAARQEHGAGAGGSAAGGRFTRNVLTFAPEGAHGVTAYVDGFPTAST